MAKESLANNAAQKVSEYQSMAASGQQILQDLAARVPYFLVALVVFLFFWGLSALFKKVVYKL